MAINVYEIVNLLIVTFLLLIIARKRDVTTLLLVLFVYGVLHFSFAVLALGSDEFKSTLGAMHVNGSGILAKSSLLFFVGIMFLLLARHASKAYFHTSTNEKEKDIIFIILLLMGIVTSGYLLNHRHGDFMQLKNVVSFEVMLALLLIGFLAVMGERTLSITKVHLWGGLFLLGITNCIAIYEVFSYRSWAGTQETSGAMVYRASGTLFNPNLLAFWTSLVYISCAYGICKYREHQKLLLSGMILASLAIYMSGSRSAGYLLFLVLIINILLLKNRNAWLALTILPITMMTIYTSANWLVMPFVSSNQGWHEIVLLGKRFAATPIYLINYIFKITGVPAEVVISIEGRFSGEGSDSGWLVLYQDVGLIGLSAVILACCMLFVRGVRIYMSDRSVTSVFALSILLYCILMGLVMRFQIFPVWLFIGIILIPCFVSWQRAVYVAKI